MKRCNNCGWFNLDSVTHCEKCDEESFEYVVENTPSEESVAANDEIVAEKKIAVEEQTVVKVDEKIEEPISQDLSKKNNFANATVAFGGNNKPNAAPQEDVSHKQPSRKMMAATIMDASSVMAEQEEHSCPKCRYPISTNVEFCPNCGATIRASRPTVATVAFTPEEESKGNNLNATVAITASARTVAEDKKIDASKPKANLNATVAISGDAKASNVSRLSKGSGSLKETVRDMPEELKVDNKDGFRLVPVELGEAIIELTLGEEVVIAGRRYKFQK